MDKPKTKASRLNRKAAQPIKLTDRDAEILMALHKYRFLTTHHLQTLTQTESRWGMNKRLRLLYDHKYIDRPKAQAAIFSHADKRPIVYALGNKGASLLSNRYNIPMPPSVYWTEKNRRVREKHIEHTLGISDFMVGILKRMFELFIEHQRKKTVALELTIEKAKTRSGSDFTSQTIGRLLTNDIVLGISGELDPLISQELFTNVQNILAMQKGKAKRKPAHLFAGLTYCGCGGKMYVPSGSHKYVCRDCKSKIHKHDLEAVFIDQIKEHYREDIKAVDLMKLLNRWSVLNDNHFPSLRSIKHNNKGSYYMAFPSEEPRYIKP